MEVTKENYHILKQKTTKKKVTFPRDGVDFPRRIAKVDQDTREEAIGMRQKEGSFENHIMHTLERK